MSNELQGRVVKIKSKPITTRRGQSTAYSVLLDDEQKGETWVGFGFEAPRFQEGSYIAFEVATNDGGFLQFVKGTGRNVEAPAKQEQSAEPYAKFVDKPISAGRKATDDRQMSIVMQHSQEMAITAVGLLLANDALAVTKAGTKAGEASRFNEILAAIDKLTVKYYFDATSDRVITKVADTGVVESTPDAAIPEPKKGAAKKKGSKVQDDLADEEAERDNEDRGDFDDDIPF